MTHEELDDIRERVRAGLTEESDLKLLLAHYDSETARQRNRIALLERGFLAEVPIGEESPAITALRNRVQELELHLQSAEAARLAAMNDNNKLSESIPQTMGVADQMIRSIQVMEPVIACAEVWVDDVLGGNQGPVTLDELTPVNKELAIAVIACRKATSEMSS